LPPKGDGRLNGKPVSATMSASALTPLSDLTTSPQLQRSNLHAYRLKVKELRNLLQMAKPRRIIEVGSGYSTKVMAAALSRNAEYDKVEGELITIDPSPRYSSLGTRVNLVPERVQEVDRCIFHSLQKGDILFLDSSHVVSVGSDTVVEYLEILPQLSKGVLVHAHDIFLPYDYPRQLVMENLSFWSEQYLLQAFISFNRSFEVLWSSSAMHACRSEVLETGFPQWESSYRNMGLKERRFVPSPDGMRVWPSSFWMRRVD
jgi:predicted O-methyltransferase YrrM